MSTAHRATDHLFLLAVAITAIAQATPTDAPNDATSKPALSTARFPDGIADEASFGRWLADQSTAAMTAAEQADAPDRRVETRLAAVSAILAAQCEPPLSRLLLGLGDASDRQRVQELTDQAGAALESAREDLEHYRGTPDQVDAATDYFDSTIELFHAFNNAIRASVDGDTSDEGKKRYRDAARDLAEYLEDDRPEVAAAAMLWQGVLYGRAGRADRAMRSLPRPAEPRRQGAVRYDFFARLLRCRYLAQGGGHTVAWALLLQLEERSREWFATDRERLAATHATFLVKTEICDAWSSTDGDEQAATREWCAATLDRISTESFPANQPREVMRLASAAPLIIAPDLATDPEPDADNAEDKPDAGDETEDSNDQSPDDDAPDSADDTADTPNSDTAPTP